MLPIFALSGLWTFGFPSTEAAMPQYINLAHSFYCIQHVEECPVTGPSVIRWSRRVDQDVRAIDTTVNNIITPRIEPVDEWKLNPRYGDCDDFVVTKRHALIKLGYPPRALRPKVVSRNKPNDHLVLEVITTQRTYVLDMPR